MLYTEFSVNASADMLYFTDFYANASADVLCFTEDSSQRFLSASQPPVDTVLASAVDTLGERYLGQEGLHRVIYRVVRKQRK